VLSQGTEVFETPIFPGSNSREWTKTTPGIRSSWMAWFPALFGLKKLLMTKWTIG